MPKSSRTLIIVSVGDVDLGKYCLTESDVSQTLPDDFFYDWCRLFEKDATVDGRSYQLKILFVSENEKYCRMRPLTYPDADVFIMCFSLNDFTSFENISQKWYPEVHDHSPKVPIVLVGTQWDRGEIRNIITEEDGLKLMEDIGAVAYIECSAKESHTIEEVFSTAIRVSRKKRKGCKCTIC